MINFNLKTQLSWRDIALRAAFIIVTVAAIVWFMPRDSALTFKAEVGTPWRYADLTASFSFPVFKSDAALAQDREEALKDYIPIYTVDEDAAATQIRRFRQALMAATPLLRGDFKFPLINRLNDLYKLPIIDTREPLDIHVEAVKCVSADGHVIKPVGQLLTAREAYEQLTADTVVRGFMAVFKDIPLNEYVVPNLFYDSLRSQEVRDSVIRSVAPISKTILAGQRIISQGDLVDEEAYQVLESYKKATEKMLDSRKTGMALIGDILYVFILILAFTVFLDMYREDYTDSIRSMSMLYALIVIFSIMASLLVGHNFLHVFIIPFAIVPIFVRVFMDSRTAFMTHMVVLLICAVILQRSLEFIAVETVGGLAVVFTLRELSSRSQLFWTAALFTLTAMLTRLALALIRVGDLNAIDTSELYYLLCCGLIVFCAYPMLYVVEKMFGFMSDITLVELSNTNKGLLRRMSEEAPGTFNHSIQVGNLAAEVARKLGGNAQLVRTGALYHDIGKMQNPIYYTENQSGGISPHDHMTYIESAQTIISHVTEGLKMADKNHLPRQIRDLIATHHGQGKAKYFYIKYKNEHPDEPVDDLLFTYPGPNPFTKEQAILMMADSVEAASRSLPDYTEQTIRQLVERIVDGMVQEGFFRECPITFRDIQYAKTVLIEKLKTIYHTRISYPEANKS